MEDCPKPAVIKKEESPRSHSSGSPDEYKRLRKSSWDSSDNECLFTDKENDRKITRRIYSADKNKKDDFKIQKLKEVYLKSDNNSDGEESNLKQSVDLPDRRLSPARIRRRRNSSSGSSIICDNVLDDRIIKEIKQAVKNVVNENVGDGSNVKSAASISKANSISDITKEKPADTGNSENTEALIPKMLPPVKNPNEKENSCADLETLHQLSENIRNVFFKRSINPNGLKSVSKNNTKRNIQNFRAKSNELERKSKNLERLQDGLRPKSEKISSLKSEIETINYEYPKSTCSTASTANKSTRDSSCTEIMETILLCKEESDARNVRKSSTRPKSANFLIMEDLEDVDINDICKDSGRNSERIKSANYISDSTSRSSYPSYLEMNKNSEDSLEKSVVSDSSTGSKISDIYNMSVREIRVSSKTDPETTWYHNFEESYRDKKSPYSKRGQLTSPLDNTKKSANNEYVSKQSGKVNQDEIESKENNKNLYFSISPKKSFGIGDSKEIQCWNVDKFEIRNIEEPNDHGDGNFKLRSGEENCEFFMSQAIEKQIYNQEMKKQFWSEIQEMLNNTDKRCSLSDIEEEKQRSLTEESYLPKIPSKRNVKYGGCEMSKSLSSSSDASIQCSITQETETLRPRKRKRECRRNDNSTKNEIIVLPSQNTDTKKKEIFDHDEIIVCKEEVLKNSKEFLLLNEVREKQTTDFNTFLAKNSSDINSRKRFKNKPKSKNLVKSISKLWRSKKKQTTAENDADLERTLSNDWKSSSQSDEKLFHNCGCFRIFYTVFRNLCKPIT